MAFLAPAWSLPILKFPVLNKLSITFTFKFTQVLGTQPRKSQILGQHITWIAPLLVLIVAINSTFTVVISLSILVFYISFRIASEALLPDVIAFLGQSKKSSTIQPKQLQSSKNHIFVFITLFYFTCKSVLPSCTCTPSVCPVPIGVRRVCQIIWSCSYRLLSAVMLEHETKLALLPG